MAQYGGLIAFFSIKYKSLPLMCSCLRPMSVVLNELQQLEGWVSWMSQHSEQQIPVSDPACLLSVWILLPVGQLVAALEGMFRFCKVLYCSQVSRAIETKTMLECYEPREPGYCNQAIRATECWGPRMWGVRSSDCIHTVVCEGHRNW